MHMLTAMTEASGETPATQDEVLAVGTRKAAAMLDISRRQLMYLIHSGQIATSQLPSSRSGLPNVHLIEVSELRAFLARHRNSPVPAA